jgi:hypothetical protein
MTTRREIDERDVDRLLGALTDVQIGNVFGMAVLEVSTLRQVRKRLQRTDC